MVRMVTTSEHEYAGRKNFPGDEFDCEDDHVVVVTMMGWAEDAKKREESKRGQGRRGKQ